MFSVFLLCVSSDTAPTTANLCLTKTFIYTDFEVAVKH